MQVRRTEVSTAEDGQAYGYRVRFHGADGQFITVGFRSALWLDDDDAVKREAITMMADTASNLGPLSAHDDRRNGIPTDAELAEQSDSGVVAGDLAEEDDDNAYQESDEALPNDAEEAAIRRDPSREGGRFDET